MGKFFKFLKIESFGPQLSKLAKMQFFENFHYLFKIFRPKDPKVRLFIFHPF